MGCYINAKTWRIVSKYQKESTAGEQILEFIPNPRWALMDAYRAVPVRELPSFNGICLPVSGLQ